MTQPIDSAVEPVPPSLGADRPTRPSPAGRDSPDVGRARDAGGTEDAPHAGEDGRTPPTDQTKAQARALADLLAPVRGRLRLAAVLRAGAAILAITPYVALGMFAQAAVAHPIDADAVRRAAVLVVLGLGGYGLLMFAALIVSHLADAELSAINRTRIVRVLAAAPLAWFTRRTSGQVRKAVENDVADLHHLVAHQQVEAVGAALTPIVAFAFCLTVDWRLAILALLPIPLSFGLMTVMMTDNTAKAAQLAAGLERVSSTVTELVDGITVVKTLGVTGRAHDRYRRAALDHAEFFEGWVRPNLRTSSVTTMLMTAPVVLLLQFVVGSWFMSAGWVSAPQLITTTLVALSLPPSVMAVMNSVHARAEARQAAERLTELLATPPLPTRDAPAPAAPPRDAAAPVVRRPARVRMESVTFGYDPARPVVHDVDLTLEPDTVTALVGESGSGKSTLATLVARFDDPQRGRVVIDGDDVRDLPTARLYDQVGFVLQGDGLLGVSLHDNIALARPRASREDVVAAARAAAVHDVIAALPRGYDSVVGEDAVLSGGERQRVAVARVILHDPDVVLLDEATSFADPDSQAQIQEALARLAHGRTVLVIAHRLATVTDADSIVVLHDGRIVERGTHDELVRAGGRYAAMWAAHHVDPREDRS